jgi:3-oxoacyl-[acyl-carrier protein] reductase
MADLEGVTEDRWDEIFDTNVKGTFLATRACADALKKAGGCVVNVASIAGFSGGAAPCRTPCPRPHRLPDQGSGPGAGAAGPGVTRSLPASSTPAGWPAGSPHQAPVRRHSARRVAESDDVAEAILGLILHGDFVTAQTLIVDGGFYI